MKETADWDVSSGVTDEDAPFVGAGGQSSRRNPLEIPHEFRAEFQALTVV